MNYRALIVIFFIIFIGTITQAKIAIFARYFGQPEFIKYQYEFFKKNLLDDYELIVIEESNDPNVSAKIINECNKYGIRYIRIPYSEFETPKLAIKNSYVGGPSFQCCVAAQYIYDHYILKSEDICMILDNDIFLLSPFSIKKYLGANAFAYVNWKVSNNVYYMLPNFLILNPSRMPAKEHLNFNMGSILGVNTDSGGYTYFYLQVYEKLGLPIPIYYLHNTSSPLKEKFYDQCSLLFNSQEWSSHYFIDKELFLHIRMGSNWSKNPLYLKMVDEVFYLFDQLLYHGKHA